MEKYVKLKDIDNLLDRLYREPRYQHEGETYYAGICAVGSSLPLLPTIELEDTESGSWRPESEDTKYKGDQRMICKNCIHYDVCQYHIDEETTMTVNECSHGFKHKDQYVKLPAYVDQPVWLIWRSWNNEAEIHEGKISMLQQKADKSWKIRISCNGSVSDYKVTDFGESVYVTFEAAEKALAELRASIVKEEPYSDTWLL